MKIIIAKKILVQYLQFRTEKIAAKIETEFQKENDCRK